MPLGSGGAIPNPYAGSEEVYTYGQMPLPPRSGNTPGEGGGGNFGFRGPGPREIPDLGHIPPINEALDEPLVDLDDPRSRWTKFWDWMEKNFHFSMDGGMMTKLLEMLMAGIGLNEALKKIKDETPPSGGGAGGGGGGGGGGRGGPVPPPPPMSGPGSYKGLNFNPNFVAWNPGGAPSMTNKGGPSALGGTPTPPPPPAKKKKKG